jgi:hypothetical protein
VYISPPSHGRLFGSRPSSGGDGSSSTTGPQSLTEALAVAYKLSSLWFLVRPRRDTVCAAWRGDRRSWPPPAAAGRPVRPTPPGHARYAEDQHCKGFIRSSSPAPSWRLCCVVVAVMVLGDSPRGSAPWNKQTTC